MKSPNATNSNTMLHCWSPLQVSWHRSNAVSHLCVGSENQPRCEEYTLIFFFFFFSARRVLKRQGLISRMCWFFPFPWFSSLYSFSVLLMSAVHIFADDSMVLWKLCAQQVEGFLVPVLVWTIHVRCRRSGCRTPSKHSLGILKQGTKPSNAHIGPCNELDTHEVCTLPLPICKWDRLQHLPCDPKRDTVVKKNVTNAHE